jgi:hypothetical protein
VKETHSILPGLHFLASNELGDNDRPSILESDMLSIPNSDSSLHQLTFSVPIRWPVLQ